jgi:hypothetical protein
VRSSSGTTPGWQGRERGQWGEQQTNLFARKQLHGIEVCNGNSYYEDAHGWAVERKMTLIGTSDIHDPSIHTDWTAEDHRTLTLVFAEERTLDSVREALFAGRTAVWQQNKLLGYEGLLAEYFPRCIQVFPVHYRHDQHAWFKIANLCPLDLKLERTGEVGPKDPRPACPGDIADPCHRDGRPTRRRPELPRNELHHRPQAVARSDVDRRGSHAQNTGEECRVEVRVTQWITTWSWAQSVSFVDPARRESVHSRSAIRPAISARVITTSPTSLPASHPDGEPHTRRYGDDPPAHTDDPRNLPHKVAVG